MKYVACRWGTQGNVKLNVGGRGIRCGGIRAAAGGGSATAGIRAPP